MKDYSRQVGTITAYVDGEQVEIGALIVTTHWEHFGNYEEMVSRCQMHKGWVGCRLDEKAMQKNITKMKLQLLWFAICNLFKK